jgi:CubicO group peptidase (beta-lactamase class C family)
VTGGLSKPRLARLRGAMQAQVDGGRMPGLVALVSRGGDTHVEALGTMAFGGSEPMARDTLFRIASMTKPVTAVAAMILVEECVLRLDDPVDRFLPELADRRVLRSLAGPVDDTVPANRPISLRDLLTFRCGYGGVFAAPGTYPIQAAQAEAGLAVGPHLVTYGPDEFLRRLAALPLLDQPGEAWRYHTGADILGVLIARASGQDFGDFLAERIFGPLGMKDTGFLVPADKVDRLPPAYMADHATGEVIHFDAPGAASRWARPLPFQSGGAGLVSTADDGLAFYKMLLGKGALGKTRILSRPSVLLMTSDQLTPAQQVAQAMFFGDNASWGMGMAVVTRRTDVGIAPGRFGWDGGYGTTGHADPNEDLVGLLLTQRMMDSPEPPTAFADFWTSAYQAMDD